VSTPEAPSAEDPLGNEAVLPSRALLVDCSSMTEVAIDSLKARLNEYLQRASEGERILITERGRSIALLGPIETGEGARDREDLRQRALQLSGRFHSGLTDLAVEHDRYLGEESAIDHVR
jgi:prevent-host-death family protein